MRATTSIPRSSARRFGIQGKLTLLFVLLSTLPLLVIGSYVIRTEVDELKAEQLRNLKNEVAELREKTSSFLSRVEGEMRLLSHTTEIQQLADSLQRDGDVPPPVAHAVEQELLDLLRDTSSYVRVNVLDATGQQVVAVMFDQGKIQAVAPDRLAARPFSFYVQTTAEMKPGQIKFSPCELRHPETGRIIPAIDCILPLFDEQHAPAAILVASVDAAKFFELLNIRRYPSEIVMVVSVEGHYLYHSQKKTNWNRLLALQEDENLLHDYPPAMVARIISGSPGSITADPSRVIAYAPLFSGGNGGGSRHFLITDVPTATVFEAIRPLQTQFILGLLGIGALSVACGHWVARRFLRPIQQLIVGTNVLREGNLDFTLALQTRDEIQDLVDSFNDMVAHWREKRALEDKMRQFITDASHELRTPLAVLRAEVELGLKAGPNPSRCQEVLLSCAGEIERLSRLVDTLLLLSNADAEKAALDFKPLNLTRVIEEMAEQARILAEDKGLEFKVGPEQDVAVLANGMRLRQLLLNLIGNSVKFTPPGGRITLSCRPVDGQGEFVVSDTGIGIEPKDMPHIFDPFYCANRDGSRAGGGYGLGLSICKWIVESHGGTIEVASTPGKGSAFTVRLPVA